MALALFLLPSVGVFAQILTLQGVVTAGSSTLASDAVNAATGAVRLAEGFPGPFSLVAADPGGRFVYVAGGTTGTTLYGATIGADGALTPVPGSPYSIPGEAFVGVVGTAMAVEASGRFLYVGANCGLFPCLLGYSIDPVTGALTAIAGSPFRDGYGAYALVSDGAGKYLYAAWAAGLSVLAIDATTGALTHIAGSPLRTGLKNFNGLAMDPQKRFLFVSGQNGMRGYAINGETGALTALASSPFADKASVAAVSFDGSGRFLYASVSSNSNYPNTLYGFAVDTPSGNLTPVPGSPFACGNGACNGVAADASGNYVYAIEGSLGVLAYKIDSVTGALTFINGGVSPGGSSIALVSAVGSPTATLQSLQIMPPNPTVDSTALGLSQQFAATGTYSDGTQRLLSSPVSWSSSDTGVATISNALGLNGLATTTGFGSTTITATLQGLIATTTLTVQSPTLISIAVTPASPTIASGTAIQMIATGTYSDGSTPNLTSQASWNSSNSAAAPVSATGLVTGVASGTANIMAAFGTLSASVPVTITSPETAVGAPPRGVVATGSSALVSDVVNAATGAVRLAEGFTGPFDLVAADPGGRFVYVAGGMTGAILYGGTIDAVDGVLTPVPGSPYSLPFAATAVAVEAGGRFLYAASSSGVQGYGIDPATGALTAVAGSPFAVSSGAPALLVSDGAGKYLYASGGGVSVLAINAATGALTEIAGSPFAGGVSFNGLAMDPLKRFLFLSTASYRGIVGAAINGSTGGLTGLASSPFFDGIGTAGVSFDGSGRFLYATQSGTDLLWGFAVDAISGNLTQVPGDPFLCAPTCNGVAGDASGKYLYAISSLGVLAYQIDGMTGALTYINGVSPGGTSVALVPAAGSPAATLQSLQIIPLNPTLSNGLGSNQQFTATGTYSDGTQRFLTSSVSWSSSNTGVATISNAVGQNGLATTTGFGSTTITATLQAVTATTTLTAQTPPLLSIAVTPSSPTIASGTALQMTATGTYSDGSTKNITSQVSWSSSNTAAAKVSPTGLATGVAPGTANIMAAIGTVSGGVPMTITAPETGVGAQPRGVVAAGGGSLVSDLVNAATGVLSQAQVINGSGEFSLVTADSSGRFVYMAGGASGTTLSGYTIDGDDGALTPITGAPYSLPGDATAVVAEASGRFLYVGSNTGVQGYGIDPATGALTAMAGSPFAVGSGVQALVSDAAGKYLYASGGGVSVLAINAATGALTEIAGSPFAGGVSFNGLAMDPQKRFLFVSGSNGVAGYAINGTTGGLTPLAGSPFFPGAGTEGVSFDGSGRFLYTTESGFNTLWGFVVDASSGNLTPVPGSPFMCNCAALADASDKYVYADAYYTGVLAYQIDGVTGALTLINSVTPGGRSVALVPAAGSPAASLQSLQIMPPNPTVLSNSLGSNQQFTATGTYSDGTQRFLTSSVSWSSSNTGVATISNALGQNGLATTTAPGSTSITAAFQGVTATTTLTVQ